MRAAGTAACCTPVFTLEMDFILEGDRDSMHVFNAVSPAFTCSLPFSRYVGERIDSCLK